MLRPWNDPAVTSIRRTPDHSPWGAYENPKQAAAREPSRWIRSLDGRYAFSLVNSPAAGGDFYRTDFDDSAFAEIAVPGCWELQGFGTPIYTNVPYPWAQDHQPPLPPEENPTGLYRRWFDVANDFLTRDVFLRFEGVETAFQLWINGEFAGYSEDSKLPCEFEIGIFLKPGRNLLAIQVMRFATSSWLEDQDYWHISGIHRSVFLIAKPKLRLHDWKITALPIMAGQAGHLEVDITINRVPGFAGCRVNVSLLDRDGRIAGEGEALVAAQNAFALKDGVMAGMARVSFPVENVTLWTPENPTLYTAVLTLLDADRREIDFESCRVGFKSIEIQNGVVLLNGKRLIVRGVNRHEHGPEGRRVSRERMREEIRQMKRLHINAVRTSHYPSSPAFYDLCDELGLLVLCECNIETHGLGALLSTDPSWSSAFLERAVRMACQFKNHVSIYGWSLGNESGYGANQAAMYGWLKEYDKTRLCQYENALPGPNISDVRGLMYATEKTILSMLTDPEDTRPVILIEVLYQIANSGGGAALFRHLTETYARFQGGFVWDWMDKTLPAKTPDGISFDGYGGSFGEEIVNDVPYMCCNGILLPDLIWKPVAYELRAVYAPFRIERRDDVSTWNTIADYTKYATVNHCFTENSNCFDGEWILKENGLEIARGALELPHTPPGEEREFTLSPPYEKKPGCEYHLDFELRRKNPAWYEEKGDLISAAQYPLPGGVYAPKKFPPADFRVVFDREKGLLEGLYVGGSRLLWGGEPRFDRPVTGLDCQKDWGWHHETAPLAAAKATLLSAKTFRSEDEDLVVFDFSMDADKPLTVRVAYRLSASGLEVEYSAAVGGGWRALPRAGLRFMADESLTDITFCGYGPGECYPDRMESARLGVYKTTVAARHFPFIPPSESGGAEGVRWLSLGGKNGPVIRVDGGAPFHFDARHNTTEELRAARYDHELKPRPEIILHLDAAHSPIGSHMAWSTDTDSRAMLGDGMYAHRFTITITGGE
ncbi:MAG: DUF4981 domain-containing protein [Oscillospiraceae bacterium]|nr:DUF4981 domain-containing protein [Oscillospiraceae bacterium]